MRSNIVFSISERVIKYLQVSTGTPKKLVTAAGVFSINDQNDTQISQSLSAFIKQRKLNFSESKVTVLIPRSRVILRHLILPSQKEDEIRSMIDLQVGSQIPYSKEEVEMDFQTLSKTPDGYAKVAVIIIPQDIAARYWKIFSDAKVPVQRITVSSVGLWLLYQQQPGISDNPAAIFDIDTDHTEICICLGPHWLTSREIPVGSARMQQEGYAEILKQWELTQINANGERSSEAIGTVYLASNAGQAKELGIEMVKIKNDLSLKEIQLTKTLSLGRGAQWPKSISEDGVSVAALAGVAFSTDTPPIDLTPKVVRQAQERKAYQRQLAISGIWAAAALITLILALAMGFLNKNIQLAQLDNQLRSTKQDALGVEEQLQKIDDIEGMIKNRLIFADLAHEIYRLLPAQIYLVSITITDGNVLSLQGVSSVPVVINQFQKDMVNAQNFSDVSLDYVNKRVTQDGEVDYFKITCKLKSVNGQK
jgi:Tfp pilus assembly PilM family ATPase/Tfp pilus assembly protein PilN